MKYAYCSIDIETTGLNPDTCQIIEIGLVLDDFRTPLHELPKFHAYVYHDQIIGEPYALSMHSVILRRIAEYQSWAAKKDESIPRPHPEFMFLRADYVVANLLGWLERNNVKRESGKITPAGKNFAAFDLQFIKRLRDAERLQFKHRTFDPAMCFWNPLEDDGPPDTKTCMQRALMEGEVAHTALEDAIGVVKMIRLARQYKINEIDRLTETRKTVAA